MREIKFRCWDPINKRMYYEGDKLNFKDNEYFVGVSRGYPLSFCTINLDSNINYPTYTLLGWCIPLQYPGLKDKNGKEIYEDDILRGPGNEIYTINWHFNRWVLRRKNKRISELNVLDFKGNWFEIIGNIYENPELLEKPDNSTYRD